MMEKAQPTLKDIAVRLNLSIGTVQRALNNKGGYSPETQRRVLEEAKKMGYTVNRAASSLSRSPISIAVVLPAPVGNNRYFYQYVWQGIELACRELAVYQISIQKVYVNTHSDSFFETLNRLSTGGQIQGMITVSVRDPRFDDAIASFREKGISYAFINADSIQQETRFSVSAGGLAANILETALKSSAGQIMLLGGSYDNELHHRRVLDFSQRMRESCGHVSILEFHEYHNLPKLRENIISMLTSLDSLKGIFAVSTRETLCMCQAVSDAGFSGKITTIGVDAFPELLPYFQDQTLTASIYHFPARLAYSIFYQLFSKLLNIPVLSMTHMIPAAPVFRSSAELFCKADGIV